ncbi:MAG: cytochrome-c peroxidase [Planctomycetes bacterium]|nr:cytochrome-c peroxidase [Planctomycetota bacterium]
MALIRFAVPLLLLPLALVRDGEIPPLPRDTLSDAQLEGRSALGLPDAVPGIDLTAAGLAKAQLGRALFFDPILSQDRTVSCASCHDPAQAFASNDVRPLGVGGNRCDRNSPPLFNRAFGTSHFWDGRAATLEQQVLMPIEHPHEMGLPLDEAVARLAADGGYAPRFAATFGAPPDKDQLAAALAEFVRRLVVADSPIDRFRAAKGPLTALERTGLWVFESKGKCWRCHAGPNFSDEKFHNTGVGVQEGRLEPGRFAVTGDPADRGAFKTPTLRMVAKTAPYMHDGSLASLDEVVRFYARGGNANDHLDPKMQPIEFSEAEIAGLIAFLEALSRAGDPPPPPDEEGDPLLADPAKAAAPERKSY